MAVTQTIKTEGYERPLTLSALAFDAKFDLPDDIEERIAFVTEVCIADLERLVESMIPNVWGEVPEDVISRRVDYTKSEIRRQARHGAFVYETARLARKLNLVKTDEQDLAVRSKLWDTADWESNKEIPYPDHKEEEKYLDGPHGQDNFSDWFDRFPERAFDVLAGYDWQPQPRLVRR